MPRKPYCYEYPRPAVTVDVVMVTREARPRVLLIRRKHEPFADCWALPGGFVDMDESLEVAARRELLEETGVRTGKLEQLATFGDPGRDPRGRVISVAYLARVDPSRIRPRGADDAAEAAWHPLARPPRLAFDHAAILTLARKKLASKKLASKKVRRAPRSRDSRLSAAIRTQSKSGPGRTHPASGRV